MIVILTKKGKYFHQKKIKICYPDFLSFLWQANVNSVYSNKPHDTHSKISSLDMGSIELGE